MSLAPAKISRIVTSISGTGPTRCPAPCPSKHHSIGPSGALCASDSVPGGARTAFRLERSFFLTPVRDPGVSGPDAAERPSEMAKSVAPCIALPCRREGPHPVRNGAVIGIALTSPGIWPLETPFTAPRCAVCDFSWCSTSGTSRPDRGLYRPLSHCRSSGGRVRVPIEGVGAARPGPPSQRLPRNRPLTP